MRTARTVLLGVTLAAAAAACLTGCGSEPKSKEAEACASELATVRTAIEAWHANAQTDPEQFPTPWPTTDDTTFGGLLQRTPTRFASTGDGSARPTVAAVAGKCPDTDLDTNELDQIED